MKLHSFVKIPGMFFVFLLVLLMSSNYASAMSPGELSGLLGLGFVITCASALWILWILVSYWVYKDAKRRGMDYPLLWFIVVFFLGLIGILIYILVRPDKPARAQVPPPPPPPP